MPRQILIIDDDATNRRALYETLKDEYSIQEAVNADEARSKLTRLYKQLSAVIIGAALTNANGEEALNLMRDNSALAQIPLIAVADETDEAAELKALAIGVNDYIKRPYSPAILKYRLRNTVRLSESASIINAMQRDKLTGLYNRETFFRMTAKLVNARPPGYYVMACFDIDSFKVINDQYGTERGDAILKHIANVLLKHISAAGGVSCRVAEDNFALIYPRDMLETGEIERIQREASMLEALAAPISFSIGRYIIDDIHMKPDAMYDRACLAMGCARGRHSTHAAMYDEGMRDKLLREQRIVNDMHSALVSGQFEIWFQPQYNHETGALIGAEALTRWRHPSMGLLVPPGEFVPIFERNGFIYELDKHIWESACRLMRKWLDDGFPPLPVSVNVSGYDMLQSDFADVLTALVRKYNLPESMLRLELEETTFSNANTEAHMIKVSNDLITRGFVLAIDNFGSLSVSPRALKDVPAKLLKLNMNILKSDHASKRGGSILEALARMASWLDMTVIAQNVETPAQADFLKSIGVSYMQGYLYADAMPESEYEALRRSLPAQTAFKPMDKLKTLDNNAFWNPESMDTLIFNSYIGGACIFEHNAGKMEVLRLNEKFAKVLGGESATSARVLSIDWQKYIDPDDREQMSLILKRVIASDEEYVCEAKFIDLPVAPGVTYLRVTMRAIARTGARHLIYCTIENLTAQRLAERKEREVSERMQSIMENVDCGITAVVLRPNGVMEPIFVNDRFCALLGYSKLQYLSELSDAYSHIHPEDRAWVSARMRDMNSSDANETLEYRAIKRDGNVIWLRNMLVLTRFVDIKEHVQLSILTDITSERAAAGKLRESDEQLKILNAKIKSDKEMLENLMNDTPGGFARLRVRSNNTLVPVYLNDGFCELLNMTREEILSTYGSSVMGGIHPDDINHVKTIISKLFQNTERFTTQYRLKNGYGEYTWVLSYGRMVKNEAGERFINLYCSDLTEQKYVEDQQKALIENLPGGAGIFYYYPDGTLENAYLNDGYYAMIGATREARAENLRFEMLRPIHPDDIKRLLDTLKRGVRDNKVINTELRIKNGKGEYQWLNVRASVAERNKDRCVLFASYSDINQLKRAQLKLEASREAMLTASRNNGITFWLYDIDTCRFIQEFADYSPLGYPTVIENVPESLLGTGEIIAEDEPAYNQMYIDLRNNAEKAACTVRVKNHITGKYEWQHIAYSRLRGAQGGARKAAGFAINVDLEQENRQRYEHELKLRQEMINNSVMYYQVNLTQGVVEEYHAKYAANGAFTAPGERVDDAFQARLDAELAPEDVERARERIFAGALLNAYNRGERAASLVYRRKLGDLGLRWVETSATITERASTRDIVAIIYLKDIDDEKKDQLAVESIMNEEIESVIMLNVETGVAHPVQLKDKSGGYTSRAPFSYEDEMENRVINEVYIEDRAKFARFFKRSALISALEKEPVLKLSYRTIKKRGRVRRKNTRAFYLDETRREIILIKRDITDLYEEEQRQKRILEKAVRAANEANRAKSDFLSRMSHDIRTPLNAVIGMVDLASQEDNPPRTAEYLSDINDSSHFLLGLINDILDLSRIESGRIEFNERPYPLEEFTRGVRTVIQPLMDAKDIEFIFEMGCGADNIVVDKLRFNQIFFNLLSNAAKFTPNGGRVSFTAEHIPGKDGKYGMRYFVRDSGRGMSDEFLKILFQPFTQEPGDISLSSQGSGLGLAIVKNLVDLMGGNISVKSSPGEGTEFVVDLYAHVELAAEGERRPPDTDLGILRNLSVLLVEDNSLNVMVAKRLLERKGCLVDVANNGMEAVRAFSESKAWYYGAILMDVRMPVMDGIEATERIRALKRPDAREVPIIAMTADAFTEDQDRTREAGMNAHLSKPIDSHLLYDTIARFANKH